MSSEMVSCKPDFDGRVAKWVCDGLGENTDWIGAGATLGVYLGEKLIAGIIFNDIRPKCDVWLTIYSCDRRWCVRRVLRCVFNFCFTCLDCRRASAFVSVSNDKSRKLVERLGFRQEGVLRKYRDNGEDAFVFGMLKEECRWL